jgi:hypothetical protein
MTAGTVGMVRDNNMQQAVRGMHAPVPHVLRIQRSFSAGSWDVSSTADILSAPLQARISFTTAAGPPPLRRAPWGRVRPLGRCCSAAAG